MITTKYQGLITTVGHSNKSFEEFAELLIKNNVQTIIDCRSKPRSRWAHFNRNALEKRLEEIGIRYEYRGDNIGGFEGNVLFSETLDELAYRADCGELLTLMCSEGKPIDCHRYSILTPELEQRGIHVKHLFYEVSNNNSKL